MKSKLVARIADASGRAVCGCSRAAESYRLWCVSMCYLETSRMRRPGLALGHSATGKNILLEFPGSAVMFFVNKNCVLQFTLFNFGSLISCAFPKVKAVAHSVFSGSMTGQPYWGRSLLIVEVSRSHSDTLTRYDCSGRRIGPSQRPPRENTQHLQEKHIHSTAGFEPTIPVSERPHTHALERAANGIGCFSVKHIYMS